MKPKDVLGLAKDRGAVMVDLKFMDFLGLWQHFTIPLAELKEEIFEEGLGFDGSSIRGWQAINESDMLVMPDADDGGHGSVHEGSRRCPSSATSRTRSPRKPTPATRATSPARPRST